MGRLRLLSIVLLVISSPLAMACTDPSGASGPDMTSVAFSVDGDACAVAESASVFEQGIPIHTVLTMTPALPAGGTVAVTVEKDGAEVVEARQTITMAEPAPCIWATMRDLGVGHYRVTYAIDPSQMGPATGEFDVVSGASAVAPTDLPADASSPVGDVAMAARIVGRLDALAAPAVRDDFLLTAQWAIDESDWVTSNMSALLEHGGTLESYVDELNLLLDAVANGTDEDPAVDRLLGLRPAIAAEFALPSPAASPTAAP